MSNQDQSAVERLTQQALNTTRRKETEKEESQASETGYIAGVLGVGAAGGNSAALLTDHNYYTVAFNTTAKDMVGLNVRAKVIMQDLDGSGKDRAFSRKSFKSSYKSFFQYPEIQTLLKHKIIFVNASGGGGTGTIMAVMIAAFLKSEYPDKLIIIVGLLGSIKEDRESQKNMLEFISDLENKTNCPYMIFDNNRVKDKQGQEIIRTVNEEAAMAIRVVAKEFFNYDHDRAKIDSRDHARLLSFKGMMSVLTIDKLNISVTDEHVDLVSRLKSRMDSSTAIFTGRPDAYGFFMNAVPDVYSSMDLDFVEEQTHFGGNLKGDLVMKHLQDGTGIGPEFAAILTGASAPLERFKQIEKRIKEYETTEEKATLPTIERSESSVSLAGDGRDDKTGKGDSALEGF